MFSATKSSGPSGYKLTRSLRLRASASSYLNRTLTTPTDTKKFTWSGWVKRGIVGSAYNIFFNGTTNAYTDFENFGFSNGSAAAVDSLTFEQYVQGSGYIVRVTTSAVYRDPSAWYHIVLVWDSANATAANRVLIYVNGSQVTSFSTATYPAQNTASKINASSSVNYLSNYAGAYFDGYLAEVNFIDGQQLTPSSFGSTNSTTGVWQPAKYTGTYGTNGFYLPFTNTTSTTTLGYDSSGNGNNWTTNNISLTAGATYDSMTDVPTLTSATAANFAVLNPLDKNNGTCSNGNLLFTDSGANSWDNSRATVIPSSGKWYWEVTATNNTGVLCASIASPNMPLGVLPGQSSNYGVTYYTDGYLYYLTTSQASWGNSWTTGDVIGVALDMDNGKVWFSKNNTWQASGDPANGTNPARSGLLSIDTQWGPISGTYYNGSAQTFNFGQQGFTYTPPSGFAALNTYNLPASSIPNGAAYMAATLYTGTGATQTITNTVGSVSFTPDFVWVKARSTANSHLLADIVRGSTKVLLSNDTAAEITDANYTTFVSGGFSESGNGNENNNSGKAYVAWNWKAGGTAVSNTNGSITSSVSANTTSGFSVIKYISNGTNGATVGHGLGVAPSLVIVKCTYPTTTQAWAVYHASLGATQYLTLQSTDAATTSSAYWNNTAPSSSVFTIGTSNDVNINSSVYTYAAYCFAAIKGFSAFGSYTGNGSTDGPFVYLGFRPRYLMLKITTTGGYYWMIKDSSRDPYNTTSHELYANVVDTEYTASGYALDFLSNGFKIKNASQSNNGSGDTYIYMAFAENPFQNSLAR